MDEGNQTLFTIGEFAALHRIHKKTLMWYDEVGIFKPAVVKENGYRYYTYFQSSMLETILLLRSLDISIPKIQEFLEQRSPENLKLLLEESIQAVDQKIKRLKGVKSTLMGQRDDVLFFLNAKLSEIQIVQQKEEHLSLVHATGSTTSEKEIGLIITATKKLALEHLHDATYGSMISVENLYRGRFEDYAALYINTYSNKKRKGLHVKPAGEYVRGFCEGGRGRLREKYMEMLEYAHSQGRILEGYAYENSLNDMVVRKEEDCVIQILIPLAKTQNTVTANKKYNEE